MKKIALGKDKNNFWTVYEPLLKNYGCEPVVLDIFKREDQLQLLSEKFDAFIWRAKHTPNSRNLAKRLIYVADVELGIPTFPGWHEFWHYDDKIAQFYIFKKLDIPIPETFLFFDKEDALNFCETAEYPLIYKSATGAGSSNVGLLKNSKQAKSYVKKAFGKGIKTFFRSDLQKDYVLFQEFLPDNPGDYRLVCVGDDTVSGFFRFNREDAPMASGSGKFNTDDLPAELLDYISEIHSRTGYDIMSYDLIKNRSGEWVVTEMSVIYGDLTHKVYDEAPVYWRSKSGSWERIEPEGDRHEQFIRFILEKWGFR